ncbi:prophage endopeptidase tail family protein [Paenibacillus brevis]|uniref:Phage tail protein n=1 Tax=Paenibacillus brevis TaxID=2841508 RepID=A0ABS6FLB8_9BACL|nr:prophage endopeptidase tail family protein [Paenibacillus brevis]MBU5670243.1 phage tail protein [Paenibacillus brevis]
MITILNEQHKPLAVLDHYFDDEITEQTNGLYTLKFSVYLDDLKSPYITVGNFAEVEGQYFNIVHHRRTRADSGAVIISAECEQVAYDLIYHSYDQFIHTGTPTTLLQYALAGTGFTLDIVEITELVSVEFKEEDTVRAIIIAIATAAGGELKFDKYKISLLRRRGREHSAQFRFGKNLLGIVKDVDAKTGTAVTSYEVNVVELRSLPEFAMLEAFELGDTVDIIDEELGINEKQRIIQYTYSPRMRINSKVVISSAILGIQDTIYRLQKTSVAKDKWMYGVKIGPEEGIVQERYDKRAKSIWNADVFKMQKGDGSGSYTDALYFNPANGEYEFSGIVTASEFIGGRIQIGNNFSVDDTGHMKAVGAEFSGDISASVISGGQINGTFINGVTVTGSTISTRSGGGKGIVMNSGWADLEIYSGASTIHKTFAIEDLLNDANLWFARDGGVIAGREFRIVAPGGVFVNGVQIG